MALGKKESWEKLRKISVIMGMVGIFLMFTSLSMYGFFLMIIALSLLIAGLVGSRANQKN